MATARLTDSQKQELVERFRQGESTQSLAEGFGCSPTTVTRLVRAELGDQVYAALRDERQKKGGGRQKQIPLAIMGSGASEASSPQDEWNTLSSPSEEAEAIVTTERLVAPGDATEELPEADLETAADASQDSAKVLAIDDADDFGDDDGEDDLLSGDEDDEDSPQDSTDFHTVAVLPIAVDDQRETQPAPWSPAVLPACAYLLVDKTVELQARPLADMPELGRLSNEEQERQALVLFTNPRQAKRHCGRTQRVIKLPDPALLGRTAPYLLAQGISRVVIEGALYALPEAP